MIEALLAYILGARCPHCGDRTRYLIAHLTINHAGDYQ